jgi:hypothetical protein
MQNFSSLASTQTDLCKFLTIFEENSRILQENSLANSKEFQTWVCNFILNLAKLIHAKFQLSCLYPDGLRLIFNLFTCHIMEYEGSIGLVTGKIKKNYC